MSLKPVRTFIKNRLAETNTGFREHKDGFNRDDIPRSLLNKSYFIDVVGTNHSANENGYVEDKVSAKIELFYKGFRTVQTSIDNAMDEAHQFRLRACNPSKATGAIRSVVVDSIDVDPLSETNDNSIIVTINLSVTAVFAVI